MQQLGPYGAHLAAVAPAKAVAAAPADPLHLSAGCHSSSRRGKATSSQLPLLYSADFSSHSYVRSVGPVSGVLGGHGGCTMCSCDCGCPQNGAGFSVLK